MNKALLMALGLSEESAEVVVKEIRELTEAAAESAMERNKAVHDLAMVKMSHAQTKAALKECVEASRRLIAYAHTVRTDRRRRIDAVNVMCEQTEDWCAGLIDAANESDQALAKAKEVLTTTNDTQ